ncbi:MAG: D-alanine--D-alanine ligase [Solirubrobacteraceae bacterium]
MNVAAELKVVVVSGGTSTERDVSLASGRFIASSLRQRDYAVAEVVWPDDVAAILAGQRLEFHVRDDAGGADVSIAREPPTLARLTELESSLTGADRVIGLIEGCRNADIVFIALHGGAGEDGTVQSVLEFAGIVHTGADGDACARAFNKAVSKPLMLHAGIATPAWRAISSVDKVNAIDLELPLVVKPARGGSTVGVTLAATRAELTQRVADTLRFDSTVLVEQYVEGTELTVGILGGDALPIVEIVHDGPLFDYAAKYQTGGALEICPARLPQAVTGSVQQAAERVHEVLGLGRHAYSRIDFRLPDDGTPVCLEANVLPGMTPLSLIRKAAIEAGQDFPEFCHRIVQHAVAGTRERAR